MTATAAETLALARDLATFRQHLAWAAVGQFNLDGEPLADAFRVLLDALEAGTDPMNAVAAALREWDDARDRLQQAQDRWRQHNDARHENETVQEQHARTATCPVCEASPGHKCQTIGAAPRPRPHVHRERIRAATTQ